jgi:predicted Fe-Mo cluster-binding NifX family protein
MKIAISADGSNLDAEVAHRFGTSAYLLIIDIDSGDFEVVPNPGSTGRHGAGVQVIVQAVSRGANAVLTGYCSPAIANQLKANGIEVLTGMTGTVRDAVEQYKKGHLERHEDQLSSATAIVDKTVLIHAIRSAARQFVTLLPVLFGVVLLIGLFDMFVSEEMLTSIFSGNVALDTLWGACFGSIFAGNPINSYVIGGELLKYGVSLFAVTAFIVTWVTVGLVQMPAEIAAFGKRFALLRNGLSFALAIPVTILTVVILNLVERWIS